MRYASLASSAGRLGIGESPVKTTTEPTACTAVHGQFAVHDRFSDMTTAVGSERRAIVKMHAGPQAELPAMIVVVRLPIDGERRAHDAIRIERGQSIEDQPPRQAIGVPATDRRQISTRSVPP